MKFNTKYKAQNIRNRFLFSTFSLIVLIVITFLTDWVQRKNETYALLVLAGGVLFVYFTARRYMYLEYDDEGEKIVLRYFKLIPVAIDHHAIEIPRRQLVRMEVKSAWAGYRQELILFVKTKNGVMKYPPVSISILEAGQRKDFLERLNSLASANR